jgi:predicted nucleic-acid-binding protein
MPNNQFLDTNILARFLLGDVVEQSLKIRALFQLAKNDGFKLVVLPEVLIELNYVLQKLYNHSKENITIFLKSILSFDFIICENYEITEQAIEIYRNHNISLEDSYFIQYCLTKNLKFYSFDQKANRVFNKLLKYQD